MSQPFRDEYAAALDRAEHLARENEDLRREVARVRVSADVVPASAVPPASPPDSLKERTLERLDELSTQIDAHQGPPDAGSSSSGSPAAFATPTAATMRPLTVERGDALAAPVAPTDDLLILRTQVRDAEARAVAAEAQVVRLTALLQGVGVRTLSLWLVGVLAACGWVLAYVLATR